MPEPIFAAGLAASYLSFAPLRRPSSAVSAEADSVHGSAQEIATWSEKSVSLFGERQNALSTLVELADECGSEGWDGYGASAVEPSSLLYAEEFIRMLPDSLPMPELSVDPDGCVSFDWLPSQTSTFTMSLGVNGRIPYAWVDGSNRGSAVERYSHSEIPPRILDEIRRIAAI